MVSVDRRGAGVVVEATSAIGCSLQELTHMFNRTSRGVGGRTCGGIPSCGLMLDSLPEPPCGLFASPSGVSVCDGEVPVVNKWEVPIILQENPYSLNIHTATKLGQYGRPGI